MSRGFYITRADVNSEDPTALVFWPPKGSDELHEALKDAFPFETNLASRMRQAVIEFLLQEQHAEQSASISPEAYLPSPQSTFVSSMPSPAASFTPSRPEMSQSRSSAEKATQQQLMDVWALPNKPEAKIHTRRIMTSDEKKAYKQKRLVGACADCKRRRRKCDHGNSSTSVSPPRKIGKHKKRMSPPEAPQTIAADSSRVHDSPVHFENSIAALDFDMSTNIMPSEFEFQTTFDMDTSPFEFPADLNLDADWPLFPEFQMSNTHPVNSPPAWALASNMMLDDRAAVAPDRAVAYSLEAQAVPGANIQYSPLTPSSLSPMSRSQSNGGQYQVQEALLRDFQLDQSFFAGEDNILSQYPSCSQSSLAPTSSLQGSPSGIEPQPGNDGQLTRCGNKSSLEECGGSYSALATITASRVRPTPGLSLRSRLEQQAPRDMQSQVVLDSNGGSRAIGRISQSGDQAGITPIAGDNCHDRGLQICGDQVLQGANATGILQQRSSSVATAGISLGLQPRSHATPLDQQAQHVVNCEVFSSNREQRGDGLPQQRSHTNPDLWSAAQAPIAALFVAAQCMLDDRLGSVSTTARLAMTMLVVSALVAFVCAFALAARLSAAWSDADNVKTKMSAAIAVLPLLACAASKAIGFGLASPAKLAAPSPPSTSTTAPLRSRRSLRNLLQAFQCRVRIGFGGNAKVTSGRIMQGMCYPSSFCLLLQI